MGNMMIKGHVGMSWQFHANYVPNQIIPSHPLAHLPQQFWGIGRVHLQHVLKKPVGMRFWASLDFDCRRVVNVKHLRVFSSQRNSNPEVPEALQCPRETSLAQVKRWLSLIFLEGNSMHSNHFTVALFSSFFPLPLSVFSGDSSKRGICHVWWSPNRCLGCTLDSSELSAAEAPEMQMWMAHNLERPQNWMVF